MPAVTPLALSLNRRAPLLAILLAALTGCGQPAAEKPAAPAPKGKQVAATLPDTCLGTFTGRTPGYSMRDQAGEVIRINGNPIEVPAIENTVVISPERIRLTQEAGGRVVRGSGPTRVIRADAEAVVLEAEVVQEETARPTYRITFELGSGTITLSQVGLNSDPPATPLVRAGDR
ncbi:MAG: hypothetical protein FJ397_09185 [Verrucomicrobia bacterium]|nr:hypothetical protein [Verrucomicrobiota bacterium]